MRAADAPVIASCLSGGRRWALIKGEAGTSEDPRLVPLQPQEQPEQTRFLCDVYLLFALRPSKHCRMLPTASVS